MHSVFHKKHLFGPSLKVQCLFLCSNILIDDIKQTNFKIPQREIHYYKTLLLYNNYCKFIIISTPVDSSLHRADIMPFLIIIIQQSMIRLLDKNYLDKIKGSWNSWYRAIYTATLTRMTFGLPTAHILTFLSSPPVTITRADEGPTDRQDTLEPWATNSSVR